MKTESNTYPSVLTDEEIIALFWDREESAIRETDVKYGRMLFRIAYHILGDCADCEECRNDTYLGVWNRIPPTRPRVFAAFISKIMRNTAIDTYKKKKSQKRISSEMTVSLDELENLLSSDASPEGDYLARELGRIINGYVHTLTARQRYIFIERFYLSEKLEHIAEELHISIATIHREAERIKQGLKAHLEGKGVIV